VITIRGVNIADALAIAAVHVKKSWRATYRGIMDDTYLDGAVAEERARTWGQRMAADEPPLVVVGESDDRMVGFACTFPAEDPKWGTRIDNLHVLPDYKRQGIATRLMGTLSARIAVVEPGLPVFLWVYDGNSAARTAYEALGGRAMEKGSRAGVDGSVSMAWRMTWPDPPAIAAG
jgi:predicted GNAT family acetyltransferase